MATEFFERFTYYGIATSMVLYLRESLEMLPRDSTMIQQMLMMFTYCLPLIGAILADCWLNKYRTIKFLMPLYITGIIVLIISSVPNVPGLPIAMLGLVLSYLALGSLRSCVVAFGGDQFILPQQESYLKKYFALFYFTINAGNFIADITISTVNEKECLGQEFCFFGGLCVIFFTISLAAIVFVSGKKFYYIRRPEGNVVLKMLKCICHALKKRGMKFRSAKTAEHWLDRAADRYDPAFINDVKIVLRILMVISPLPIFRALFDQHGSRWIHQAARMSGEVGKLKLEATYMNAASSVFILLSIPLFEAFLYPAFARYNFLKKPLQRLTIGGLLAALAFVVSALVESQLEPSDDYLPKAKEAQIRLFNGLAEPLSLTFIAPDLPRERVPSLGMWSKTNIPTTGQGVVRVRYRQNDTNWVHNFEIFEKKLTSYIFTPRRIVQLNEDDSEKSKDGAPKIRLIYIQPAEKVEVKTSRCGYERKYILTQEKPYTPYEESIDCNSFEVEKTGVTIFKHKGMTQGGIFAAFIIETKDALRSNILTIVEPNTLHMLWLVPQYVLITAGEVMISITGFEFSYTQAPVTMKALMQAAWLLTAAIGKVIVISAGETKLADRLFSEFMLFAALMALDMFIFAALAMRYKYVQSGEHTGINYDK